MVSSSSASVAASSLLEAAVGRMTGGPEDGDAVPGGGAGVTMTSGRWEITGVFVFVTLGSGGDGDGAICSAVDCFCSAEVLNYNYYINTIPTSNKITTQRKSQL